MGIGDWGLGIGTLDMVWEAETDKPTIINQTNHNYYNLSGDFIEGLRNLKK